MLGLVLREEFQGKRLKGTAIELTNEKNTGATQVPAAKFLEVTYPTTDVVKALDALKAGQGRPLVLIGERGQGKSHLLGTLYHALNDGAATSSWLATWSERLNNAKLADIPLRSGMQIICESLHRQRYKFLWDLLLDNHPHGEFIRGKWEAMGNKKTDVPPDTLLLELFKKQSVALLLDEFQTWFEGLTNTKQYPWRQWAFNFIQILSEIAKEHPELLVLVVSVRDGTNDAYQQVHRVNPIAVDFKGPNAERDRRRLLLHRLFENRIHVAESQIDGAIGPHVAEYFRLANVPESEHDRRRRDFLEAWPFAPHLLQLLEDQVLVSTAAQETRDLIRILVELYKSRGETNPVLTAADFRVDDDASGIAALLASVANEHHAALREKAIRNLSAVKEAVKEPDKDVPHLEEIVGALWLRSIAEDKLAGAEPPFLQIDITRTQPVDDNAFTAELATIVENSFNIHQVGRRLLFREDENPQAKVMASARNDKLFQDGADRVQLAKEIRYVLGGNPDVASRYRVVVLQRAWQANPWDDVEETERPDRWDERLPYIVLPEEPDKVDARLGQWLKDHLQKRRNTVRFLIPRAGSTNAFSDRSLLILARAIVKAQEWQPDNPEYGKLHKKFQAELRELIQHRFDRFAVLRTWSFTDPSRCRFAIEAVKGQGSKVLDEIEKALTEDVFVPEDFDELVKDAAQNNEAVASLMRDLQEPRPNEAACVPWLGEHEMKERLVRLCAAGVIAINLRGTEYLQRDPGEDEDVAWRRMRGKLGTGKHLEETRILVPAAVPPPTGGVQPTIPFGGGGPPPVGPSVPGTPPPTTGGGDPPVAGPGPGPGGGIFGGGPPPAPGVPLASPPTSSLNLLGKIETWGIGPATELRQVTLKVDKAKGAQLKKLLEGLPDGVTYELSMVKEK